ncbi:NADH dehydrogenase [ubiquinone] 1 alpha subcomplex subunit 6 [Nilaparvata lugens]|uniref:NADH dehydrogenase [ubiquinone] 1 alpha subcomplex subunit 6 n=1 Tax=Nilaparvata lugens TaxID=108931 RepID=UPI00193CE5A0|nr:NADH dehydrogenase [ubiquinone] 1 alpha subcomplex subunit 6 [Nilaparvata lugens]
MSANVARPVVRQVKPLLSLDKEEARKRALNLYKAWYRQIPYIVRDNTIPKSVAQCRAKLREEFEKHRNLTDIRVIDMLVIKGQMELKSCANKWSQSCHVMNFFKESYEPKPKDFLSKFMEGRV